MLEVTNVDLHYGAAIALRQVSITAVPGAVTCLLGRNGVGKTSLLRAIVGAHPITLGRDHAGKAPTSPACRSTSARGAASPGCRRAATSFRC